MDYNIFNNSNYNTIHTPISPTYSAVEEEKVVDERY